MPKDSGALLSCDDGRKGSEVTYKRKKWALEEPEELKLMSKLVQPVRPRDTSYKHEERWSDVL